MLVCAVPLLRLGATQALRDAPENLPEEGFGSSGSLTTYGTTTAPLRVSDGGHPRILQRFGNRGYRAAQLEAGIIGGKLYLSAYAQRLGATGLTFYDDEVTAFFSPHAAGKSVMFLTALGRSAKTPLSSSRMFS